MTVTRTWTVAVLLSAFSASTVNAVHHHSHTAAGLTLLLESQSATANRRSLTQQGCQKTVNDFDFNRGFDTDELQDIGCDLIGKLTANDITEQCLNVTSCVAVAVSDQPNDPKAPPVYCLKQNSDRLFNRTQFYMEKPCQGIYVLDCPRAAAGVRFNRGADRNGSDRCCKLGSTSVKTITSQCLADKTCSAVTIFTDAKGALNYCFKSDSTPLIDLKESAKGVPCTGCYVKECRPADNGFRFVERQDSQTQYKYHCCALGGKTLTQLMDMCWDDRSCAGVSTATTPQGLEYYCFTTNSSSLVDNTKSSFQLPCQGIYVKDCPKRVNGFTFLPKLDTQDEYIACAKLGTRSPDDVTQECLATPTCVGVSTLTNIIDKEGGYCLYNSTTRLAPSKQMTLRCQGIYIKGTPSPPPSTVTSSSYKYKGKN